MLYHSPLAPVTQTGTGRGKKCKAGRGLLTSVIVCRIGFNLSIAGSIIPDIFFAILASSSLASPSDFMPSFAVSVEAFSFPTFSALMGSGGTFVRSVSVGMMGGRNVDKSVLNEIK